MTAAGDTATNDVAHLADLLGPLATRNAAFGARTTYRAGGTAAVMVEAVGPGELAACHRALTLLDRPVPVVAAGKGSNLLVADAGFPGLVIVLTGSFSAMAIEPEQSLVRAGAAVALPVAARQCAAAGLRGFEWAVGVPGSIGGAVRMNAGGHGSDMAAVLAEAEIFDLATGRTARWTKDDLELGYRRSAVEPRHIVLAATLSLAPGDRTAGEATLAEVVRWRRDHQPGGSNAGSVFANPEGTSAGALIESAGLKGFRIGSAHVSEKHANFFQCDDGGSADDVRSLIEHVRDVVAQQSGIELATEVRMLGFDGDPLPMVYVRHDGRTT